MGGATQRTATGTTAPRQRTAPKRFRDTEWEADKQRPPTTAKRAKTSDSKLVDQKKSKRKSMTKRKGQKQHQPPRLTATQRRAEKLQAALAARGLELRSDSRLCREYIGRGGFDLEFVVDTMDEMRFYINCTAYDEYHEMIYHEHLLHYDEADPDDISAEAKEEALKEWASTFDTAEEAAADPALPASLHTKVRAMPWPPEVRDITDSAEMELEEDHGCKGRCRACMMRSGYSSDSGDNYGWY